MSIIKDRIAEEFENFDFSSSPIAAQLAKDVSVYNQVQALTFPKPSKTRIVSVTNQKGGVGKTTTVVNFAVSLAQAGLKVLVVDLDPQGNASTALGIPYGSENRTPSSFELLSTDLEFEQVIRKSESFENLFVVPSNITLSTADLKLAETENKEYLLKNKLVSYLNNVSDFDYVFFDCPPSMGVLVVNALTAANEVLVTIQAEYYALEGIALLTDTIKTVQEKWNSEIRITGALITMFDNRSNLSADVFNEVKRAFPDETLATVIPRNVRVAEAPSFGESVVTYDPRSTGAVAYQEAALEFANKELNNKLEVQES